MSALLAAGKCHDLIFGSAFTTGMHLKVTIDMRIAVPTPELEIRTATPGLFKWVSAVPHAFTSHMTSGKRTRSRRYSRTTKSAEMRAKTPVAIAIQNIVGSVLTSMTIRSSILRL